MLKQQIKNLEFEQWYKIIAYLINCDNSYYKFTDAVFTNDSIRNSNSSGELFPIYLCINMITDYIECDYFKKIVQRDIIKIINGEIINKYSKNKVSNVGMLSIDLLYRMPDDFKLLIAEIKKIM